MRSLLMRPFGSISSLAAFFGAAIFVSAAALPAQSPTAPSQPQADTPELNHALSKAQPNVSAPRAEVHAHPGM